MDLTGLIGTLSRPDAYSYPVGRVDVRQTHISVVFLAGPFVYKLKKPVKLNFLDFSTLELRRHFCRQEVDLNRRLAPEVYLGVVPVVRTSGGVQLEGEGEVIDWAVKMKRLPDEACLLHLLEQGKVDVPLVQALARRLAGFHRTAEAGPRVLAFGRFAEVTRSVLGVFDQCEGQVGAAVSRPVCDRTRALVGGALARLRPLIESRAARGLTRDGHGDLHLDHIYVFPDRQTPADLVMIDGIEFNEQLRCTDPVADMAFPVMDLIYHGRRDLASAFADAYFEASADEEGRALLPLYTAYRAAVRARVEGLLLAEEEVSRAERGEALMRARAHWLLALAELEQPSRKPCLLLVGGLPGAGKSTLARRLAEAADFQVLRSDVISKELAGQSLQDRLRSAMYAAAWKHGTYDECLHRAERLLFEGKRVLVDATFRAEKDRRTFLEAARRWGVPCLMLLCQASPKTVRCRLQNREGNASDADWLIYLKAVRAWEEIGAPTRPAVVEIATEGSPDQVLARALAALEERDIHGEEPKPAAPRKGNSEKAVISIS